MGPWGAPPPPWWAAPPPQWGAPPPPPGPPPPPPPPGTPPPPPWVGVDPCAPVPPKWWCPPPWPPLPVRPWWCAIISLDAPPPSLIPPVPPANASALIAELVREVGKSNATAM